MLSDDNWLKEEERKHGTIKGIITGLIIALLIVVFLSSCATQKRCFDKYGSGQIITVRDTFHIEKEVVKFSFQTLIDTLEVVDTFIINKERVRAIFTRDTILIECKADTIYTEKIIQVPSIDKPDKKFWQFKEFWISIGGIVFLLIVLYISRR
jgi:hypothetical protein